MHDETMRYLTVAQVADRLQMSQATIRARCRSGDLPAVNIAPRAGKAGRTPHPRWRIDEEKLDAWLAGQANQ